MSFSLCVAIKPTRYFKSRKELERFLEKNVDKINWYWIPEDDSLSEEFLERFSDRINWFRVFRTQNFSIDFLIRHSNKIKNVDYVYALVENKYKPLKKIESKLQLIRVLFSINDKEARSVLRRYWYSYRKGGKK